MFFQGGLTCTERVILYEKFFYYYFNFRFPEFANFPEPFDKAFGYGLDLLNLRHLTTQALIKVVTALELAKRQKTLTEDRLGNLIDNLRALFSHEFNIFYLKQFCKAIKKLWVNVNDSKLVDIRNMDKLIPSHEDFVTGTVKSDKKKNWFIEIPKIDMVRKSDKLVYFGKAL